MLLLKDTVGKLRRLLEDVFDVVEEDIFPRSLMGATVTIDTSWMQHGLGSRV